MSFCAASLPAQIATTAEGVAGALADLLRQLVLEGDRLLDVERPEILPAGAFLELAERFCHCIDRLRAEALRFPQILEIIPLDPLVGRIVFRQGRHSPSESQFREGSLLPVNRGRRRSSAICKVAEREETKSLP